MRRFIKRLLGVPESESATSGRDIFPDLKTDRDLGQLLGMFNPTNSTLYSQRLVKQRDEQLMIRRGELDQAAVRIKQQLVLMNAEERLSSAFLTTNDVHELRHVHDYFGTVTGFERFLRTIDDGFEFTKTWRALIKRGTVKLPLQTWAQQNDAPAELKQYASARKQYIEWCYLVQGSMARLQTPVDADTIVLYSLKGQPVAPALSFPLTNVHTGERVSYAIPYGMHAIMESTAFILQRYAIRRVYGNAYAEQAKQALHRGSKDAQFLYYTSLELLANRYCDTPYIENLLAVADLAMMPGSKATGIDAHPGQRLLKLMIAAKSVAPLDERPTDLESFYLDYMDRLAAHCGWQKPSEVVSERIRWCRSILKKDPGDSVWDLITHAAIRLHLYYMELREKFGALFAVPVFYMTAAPRLPLSPVWIDGASLQFWGVNEHDAVMFGQWYYMEHFQRQVWFEQSMICAFPPGAHTCARNKFDPGWEPESNCPFTDVVELMGRPQRVEILN